MVVMEITLTLIALVSYKIELERIGCTLEPVSVINANGAVLYIVFYFVHCTI